MHPDGILYASQESHYSVFKAARMYRMECVKVATSLSGEIDCADFKAKLLVNKDKPAIVNVNIGCSLSFSSSLGLHAPLSWCWLEGFLSFFAGTTVKGAVDDLDLVLKTLEECGFPHDRFYIHCDGALFGLMMPFVKRVCTLSNSFDCQFFWSYIWFQEMPGKENVDEERKEGNKNNKLLLFII